VPRVLGIDPGTVSLDVCGLDDGRLFLDCSLPTSPALADPSALLALIADAGPLDLVVGPSGYGLPVTSVRDLTESDLRLAFLAAPGETGGIGGLRALVRMLSRAAVPMVLVPGVVHLASVPAHRKVNRVDMGTADKVCAVALAIRELAGRHRCRERDVSFILLELGGAFTAAIAVEYGAIVDGAGGSSGPLGVRAAGALDGEVAFLAGAISKHMVFGGGVAAVAGVSDHPAEALTSPQTPRAHLAAEAFLEGAVKAVVSLTVSAPAARHVVLSGRMAGVPAVRDSLTRRFGAALPGLAVHVLTGVGSAATLAAQGAALLADGLAGGQSAHLVDVLGIREASGTVLDHLYVISPAAARRRLGSSAAGE
jgi:predicted butyrate kinase (DUF1464 family)